MLGAGAADAESGTDSRGLQQALTAPNGTALYENSGKDGGFSLSSSLFSGRASGAETSGIDHMNFDRSAAALEGDQRLYALLIDGSYDFNYDADESSSLRPYVGGSVGMAVFGQQGGATSGAAVPLFRLSGGIAYRLGEQWNMSLDYKAGFTAPVGDQIFTGRGQQPVDLQTLNMGVKYRF